MGCKSFEVSRVPSGPDGSGGISGSHMVAMDFTFIVLFLIVLFIFFERLFRKKK